MVNADGENDTSTNERKAVPKYGWSKEMNGEFDYLKGSKPVALRPTPTQIASLLGLAYRFWRYTSSVKRKGRVPFMDPMNPQELDPYKGVPMGGIGGGTVCRSWKGHFNRWNLVPGIYSYETVWADQFIVRIQRPDQSVYQVVLCASSPKASYQHLSEWNWEYTGEGGTYHALYPRAWSTYDLPEHKIKLVCRQISPVIPHDYEASSLPACVFEWSVENYGDTTAEVAICMTWVNGYGAKDDKAGGHQNYVFSSNQQNGNGTAFGIEMKHKTDGGSPYSFGISALQPDDSGETYQVTYEANFTANGSGSLLWNQLLTTGHLKNGDSCQASRKGQVIGAAVSCSVQPKPSETVGDICFTLTWDSPEVDFPKSDVIAHRQYTRYFGNDGRACAGLCSTATQDYRDWEKKIDDWQSPILNDSELPDWYKSALFNESYFVADGGTVWLADKEDEIGRFGYLEGHEYRMVNTYDVHFYASWALTLNWPKIASSIQRDYADAIMVEDKRSWPLMMGGTAKKRTTKAACPHDLGDPQGNPWVDINCYNIHDTATWKDLGPKFVLQVYRDYKVMEDVSLLEYCWPSMSATMAFLLKYDKDNDGVIENENFADQTYDVWLVDGVSAYCGGLWVGATTVMAEAAKVLSSNGRTLATAEDVTKWSDMAAKGKAVYDKKLWNGKYYNYDESNSAHNDSIQSDQCAAHFYLQASGVPSFCESEKVQSALKTVFSHNVMQTAGGTMGAINGCRPNGSPDYASMQSVEIWTGVTYQVAAGMIQEGLVEEGFKTAKGVYDYVWLKSGMAFQTPEGYFPNGNYRSLCYMRPLSIWAMQHVWEQRKSKKSKAATAAVEPSEATA